jgi:hypothetical protein
MDFKQLQNEKLNLIQWINQIEDHHLIEKIKSLMKASNQNLQITKEQEVILDSNKGKDIGSNKENDTFYNDAKTDYKL